ncbi:MAG TPA: DUF2278 family protein [Bacteroidia bacterium]|jgi:hypothetical protein|nr:DUF2278 family protein [Bacteroidia bacterium]
MLPNYGVTIGTFKSSSHEQGTWLQEIILLNTSSGTVYQCNVDVNEPSQIFQYMTLNGLKASLFQNVSSLSDGYHELARNASSGAIDYIRSPFVTNPEGCLAVFYALLKAFFGSNNQVWNNVTGDEAGQALVQLITPSKRLYIFGAPYASPPPPGAHDVHCNQGDTVAEFQHLDGVWQDGCVIVENADGTLSGYFGKFATQTFPTDNTTGLPV